MAKAAEARYTLPAVVAVALQSNRPEVLRALKDEAADKLKELPEEEKAAMVGELFKLIADLMQDKQLAERRLNAYRDVHDTFERAKDDMEAAIDEVGETLKEISRDEREAQKKKSG
jgi:electron transfer flavoprotein alpha/beta subunit